MSGIFGWFKFRAIKSAFIANRATLFRAEHAGDSKIAIGGAVQLTDSQYRTTAVEGNDYPLEQVMAARKGSVAALVCRRCGHWHVIMAQHRGVDLLTKDGSFGRFDRYQGLWRSSWFRLTAPIVTNSLGVRNQLVCRRCAADDVPRVHLY